MTISFLLGKLVFIGSAALTCIVVYVALVVTSFAVSAYFRPEELPGWVRIPIFIVGLVAGIVVGWNAELWAAGWLPG